MEFSVSDNESILQSAINSNVYLEHSCINGNCGSCKVKIIKGTVNTLKSNGLSESEIEEGYVLACCAKATSDLELIANYYPELSTVKRMIQPCKVAELDFPANDVAILKLKLPPTANFKFLAGQFIDLMIKGDKRSYSIANIAETYNGIELHIRKVNNGLFSDYIFNELKLNQLLRIDGPIGSFFVRDGNAPIIFLAGGTGFAPIKAMVEKLITNKVNRKIYIYWGVSKVAGFYSEVADGWQSQYSNIIYTPVLSGDEVYSGKKGLVHQAVLNDFSDLSKYEVYACGSSMMIDAARNDFVTNGLNPENFYSDAFVASEKVLSKVS